MTAYYNENDAYAAQWLRNLIDAGHIAPGVVDERSIQDIAPDDLKGFTQCHFFAGVGVWSLALRRAGWPDSWPVWTGSCPCQPYSAAGAQAGFADERHLWPDFAWLINQRRPPVILGEQVASKAADPWVDLVQADVEAMAYAFGAIAFPAASVGAPHIRDRTYWAAHAEGHRRERSWELCQSTGRDGAPHLRATFGLGNADHEGLDKRIWISGVSSGTLGASQGQATERTSIRTGGLGDTDSKSAGRHSRAAHATEDRDGPQYGDCYGSWDAGGPLASARPAGPVNALWADADWLFCRDGKWRPVEPGTFPLADGVAARMGRLRAYGNAICVEAATQFIAAYLETQKGDL